jgi:uncharacterized membrane protein
MPRNLRTLPTAPVSARSAEDALTERARAGVPLGRALRPCPDAAPSPHGGHQDDTDASGCEGAEIPLMYDEGGWGWGWWMMGGGLLLLLLVLVAAVVAIVVVVRPPRDTHSVSGTPPVQAQGPSRSDEPLRELDLRFARGEVDEDGYRRARHLLTHPPAS